MRGGNQSELTIWTFDWVPDGPRGYVRDLRLRWACEKAIADQMAHFAAADATRAADA